MGWKWIMKITVHNQTSLVYFESENDADIMALGRISSRLKARQKPTCYNKDGPWKLDCSIQEMVDLLAS